jgi:hypothetical protein
MRIGRGDRGHWDPFYAFEQLARDHEPAKPPKPSRGALMLVEALGSRTAAVVMGCVLAIVVLGFLIVVVFRT